MKYIAVFISLVAWASAAVLPLGYNVSPKIPVTTNVPVITNVPVVTTVPVTLPSCGCGLNVATALPSCSSILPCGCASELITVAPVAGFGCGCGCAPDLITVAPACGCGVDAIQVVAPCSCGYEVPSCGCNACNAPCSYACGPSCLTVDPVTALGCSVPVLANYGCGCNACNSCGCGCGCPTLPPLPPVVGCCGKYLRQICIQPPFL